MMETNPTTSNISQSALLSKSTLFSCSLSTQSISYPLSWPFIALSLAVKDLTSTCKVLGDSMGIVGEICILVKFSPKREKMLESIQKNVEEEMADELIQDKHLSLDPLCVTRWTVRASCFLKIINDYDELLTLWEESPKADNRYQGKN